MVSQPSADRPDDDLHDAPPGQHGGAEDEVSHHDVFSGEELRDLIDLSRKHGMVGKQERDMLGGILDLAGVEVSEVQDMGAPGKPTVSYAYFKDPDGNSWALQQLPS